MRTHASRRLPALTLAAAATALAVPTRDARACGPEFPPDLLSNRGRSLLDLREGIFADEAVALVPPPSRRYDVVADGAVDPRTESLLEGAFYAAGARAFHAGDLAAAAHAFEAILALPPAARRHRSTFAAYMLGRVRDGDAAIRAYQQVRALTDAGFLDEAGLAASSLGQEARLHYRAGDTATAVRLYAEQAAHGHGDGATSLLIVVRDGIRVDHGAELAASPIGQRLLAAYLYSRRDELTDEQYADLVDRLAALPAVAGADRLAAAVYRAGDWDRAASLVARADDSAIARWVRAKLALRAGDTATAERLLASIADADPAAPDRVSGERTALALAGDRPLDAMAHAWRARATFPEDALHVAERVLTIDELIAFVDALPGDAPAHAPDDVVADDLDDDFVDVDSWWAMTTTDLRLTLARRLMRAGRYAEASPYFTPALRPTALAFATAMTRAARTGDRFVRARALYDASRIARRDGLEILGTSLGPDWAFYDAQFDPSDHGRDPIAPDPWTGAVERARIAASAPSDPHRYHYRFLASTLAEQAAELMPHQSQAFAASLCWSARHIFYRDSERVQRLYARYVDRGPAAVDMDFGQTCPEPEFDRARRFLRPPRAPAPRWPLAVIVALAGVTVVALVRRLRPLGRQVPRP
ncbi:MAG TPA: hypothetical protein VM734_29235 [Kofleriaceae bacterium]|nr:hypothetical protein [Kofleriaceae bacterium]